MRIEALEGQTLIGTLPLLAQLRIEVFRAWPYLYDGAMDYEEAYLAALASAPDAVIIAAFDAETLVGCATGSSLDGHHDQFAAPLAKAGVDLATTFYCGESVLRSAYRGRGIGHAFFDQREAHARSRGYARCCFCAVIRPADHPLRDPGYRPLDAFWRSRGYHPLEGAIAQFGWKDVGEDDETQKPMQVWLRDF